MLLPFDIFKVGKDEIPVWVEAAETAAAVKTRVKELFKLDPAAEYVIFSQQTQNKISVRSDTPLDF
jgi:hypothetical protein